MNLLDRLIALIVLLNFIGILLVFYIMPSFVTHVTKSENSYMMGNTLYYR